ncbi:MAG: T9SS type A sorting domain-containing protein [Bacteroidia bacterium]
MKKLVYLLFILNLGILKSQSCFQTIVPPTGYFFTYPVNTAGENITRCVNNDVILSCVLTDNATGENSNTLIRYDQAMNVIWSKKINVAGFPDIAYEFHKVTELPNGDLYVYFLAYDDDYYAYHYAMRMNSSGDLTWSKNFYVDHDGNPYGPTKLKVNVNGDMLVVLSYVESVHVVRLNCTGTIVFGCTIETDSTKNPGFDCELRDDCSIITAKADSDNDLIKIDNDGNVIWSKRYTDTSFYTQPRSICNAADGNFLVAGLINTDQQNGMLMKIDSAGSILWTKQFSSSTLGMNGFDKVVEKSNGNILLYEFTASKIVECDAAGNIISTKVMSVQNAMSYELTPTNFMFLGTKYMAESNDYATILVTDDLSFAHPDIFTESAEISSELSVYAPTLSTAYTVEAMDFATMPDSAVMINDMSANLAVTGNCISTTGIAGNTESSINVFPNPASSEFTIDLGSLNGPVSLSLCDVNGKTVKTLAIENLSGTVKMNVSDLNSGMYFLKAGISGDAPVMNKRVVVSH